MWLDGLHNEIMALNPLTQNYAFQVREIFAGNGQSGSTFQNNFQGCIGTYRYNRRDLPLNLSYLSDEMSSGREHKANFFDLAYVKGVTPGCSQLPTCASLPTDYCPLGQVCIDFWKGPFCVCGTGQHVALSFDGTLGRCNENAAVASLGISSTAVIMILTCLMLLICKFTEFYNINVSSPCCNDDGLFKTSKTFLRICSS